MRITDLTLYIVVEYGSYLNCERGCYPEFSFSSHNLTGGNVTIKVVAL